MYPVAVMIDYRTFIITAAWAVTEISIISQPLIIKDIQRPGPQQQCCYPASNPNSTCVVSRTSFAHTAGLVQLLIMATHSQTPRPPWQMRSDQARFNKLYFTPAGQRCRGFIPDYRQDQRALCARVTCINCTTICNSCHRCLMYICMISLG